MNFESVYKKTKLKEGFTKAEKDTSPSWDYYDDDGNIIEDEDFEKDVDGKYKDSLEEPEWSELGFESEEEYDESMADERANDAQSDHQSDIWKEAGLDDDSLDDMGNILEDDEDEDFDDDEELPEDEMDSDYLDDYEDTWEEGDDDLKLSDDLDLDDNDDFEDIYDSEELEESLRESDGWDKNVSPSWDTYDDDGNIVEDEPDTDYSQFPDVGLDGLGPIDEDDEDLDDDDIDDYWDGARDPEKDRATFEEESEDWDFDEEDARDLPGPTDTLADRDQNKYDAWEAGVEEDHEAVMLFLELVNNYIEDGMERREALEKADYESGLDIGDIDKLEELTEL
jgi:hypothetical protein